jgi:hypothetical protein
MNVTSLPSATLTVSLSPSLAYHSHRRNSLPRKSRDESSAIQVERPPAGGHGVQPVAERLLEQRHEPVHLGERGGAEQHLVGQGVPQHRDALPPLEPPVLGLGLQPVAGVLPGLPLLPGRRHPARVLGRKRLQLDGVVGPHQIAGQLVHVHPQVAHQHVADDVLGQAELGVQDVFAGRPADLDAVGRGDPRLAGRVGRQPLDERLVEPLGGRAVDPEAQEGGPTGEERHAAASGVRANGPDYQEVGLCR